MREPEIKIYCISNIYIRQMVFPETGCIEIGHSHPFDHISLLTSGSVFVKVNGQEKIFKAPAAIFIKKEVEHEFTSLEDKTILFCIHALRFGERVEDIIDPDSIPFGDSIDEIAMPLICLASAQLLKG